MSLRSILAVEGLLDDSDVPEKLPFAPDRYFKGGEDIPLRLLVPIRARPKGVHNARVFMWQSYNRKAERRKPLSLKSLGNGKYEVLDGNSTFAVAEASQWPSVRGVVVDTPVEH